jgi:glutamate dehydrogenase
MNLNTQCQSVLIDNVFSLMDKKIATNKVGMLKQFATMLYRNMSGDDLQNRDDSDLYGATVSLWNYFETFDKSTPHIRVFNPEIEKHGWQSIHTIIEVIVTDMPFLVNSVRMCLNRLNITSHLFLHSPLRIVRDEGHTIKEWANTSEHANSSPKETVFLIEIDRQDSAQAVTSLTTELKSVLDEVTLAVCDWKPMSKKLSEVVDNFTQQPSPANQAIKEECHTFLKWVHDHNFTLMGYRHYSVLAIEGDFRWVPDNDSSLGLMKKSISDRERLLSNLPASARDVALSSHPFLLTKTRRKSRVHRPAQMDYIGVKEFNAEGQVIGEHRFIGLYSASFYNSQATDLPVLKSKIDKVCELSGFAPGSHAYKAFLNIIETYPRDELLQTDEQELANIINGIFQMQERGISRIFVRKDNFGRFFSCLVYVPRERYNTKLRKDTQALLKRAFDSKEDVEFTTYFSESVYARTHYIAHVKDNNMDIDVKEIENNLIELTKSWDDRLAKAIRTNFGEAQGKTLENRYQGAFSRSYMEACLPSAAVVDIEKLEALSDEEPLGMLYYRPQEETKDSPVVKLKLFHKNEPIHLSAVLPMLENFGLRVIDESPYKITITDENVTHWIMDFSMLIKTNADLSMEQAQTLFQDAFAKVWLHQLEDDAFNRLVLGAGLTGRKVTVLRAYAKYMRQTGSSFSHQYIADTLFKYPDIAKLLVQFFDLRFDPFVKRNNKKANDVTSQINEKLDSVNNLDDDRIIRRYIDMIQATFRTNFYQQDSDGAEKSYVSFKLQPQLIPDMPLPLPKFEIFVYSPRMEGVHLRGGKVARGGLRWSDRLEDFRTEILGLVKAQQVKNTVIVPVGAKGGFICKKPPQDGGRAALIEEGKACYRLFIRSLLDITDNIVDGAIKPPTDVVRHDDDDAYLVVAADKGTATFSDIANGISEEFNFWLGDAFASGGSIGYDHKKMGITAKGGWESVKRHFREIGINCQTTDFTCIGIGDMAGDVFGNGMLLSEHTRLIAAFNHVHIFFDPNPDAKSSYAERKRLFDDPSLGWQDYNTRLISAGGGVFNRASKAIVLTEEMKKCLGTKQQSMTPNELIHNILKMKVDLLWNGGIGTYVKSAKESHSDVGDRANETVRVNGNQLQVKIVGEGGNLGCTQLGRIEFANHGGRINTDFIDNVGGVDCSDNEVNIKILLNQLVKNGDLTTKQRNELLYSMTDDVSELVLQDCYRQTQSISITELGGVGLLKEQLRFIHGLEREGALNRELEFIPSDEEVSDRAASGKGLTRPELSVLIAYGKMVLKEKLNVLAITANPYHEKLLIEAFPERLQTQFAASMQAHPLKNEIVATKLSNEMVNDMGLNFVFRMQEETGASNIEITNAYCIVKGVFGIESLWEEIEALDNKLEAKVQLQILENARRLMRRAARWFIRHGDISKSIEESIEYYASTVSNLLKNLESYLVKTEFDAVDKERKLLIKQGLPKHVALQVACFSNLFSALDLAQIAGETGQDIACTARLYYQLGAKLELHWFLNQINSQAVANHWQALARASYREELDWQQRSIVATLLQAADQKQDADTILQQWMSDNEGLLKRWYLMMTEFKTSSNHEFAKFSVALRELMLLSVKTNH